MGVNTLGDGAGIGVAGFGEGRVGKCVGWFDGLFWLQMVRRRARAVGGDVDSGGSMSAGDVEGGHVRK